ncbi:MAG: pyrroline-5-carboxylate reductase [Ruminococcaceae bacterium]|nr:pyrroline-5-carboxylate reductase [Oscillospiraceae bacterium]
MKYKIGFIGIGNMGGALLRGVARKLGGDGIAVADMDKAKLAAASSEYGCTECTAAELAAEAEYIFLGVKPQMMAEMLEGIGDALCGRKEKPVLVSMAAGLTVSTIREMAGGDYPVVRIMPNIPASVGEGMILYTATEDVTEAQLAEFCDFMEYTGVLDRIPEGLIDAGSAVSGCGPAFAAMFMEALADGAVTCGLPRAKAMLYAEQMLIGTAKYLMETGMHPGQLKDNVTSPGGTTICGVRALEEGGFRSAAAEAVVKAFERTLELKG